VLSACSRAPEVALAPQASAPVCASAWGDPALIARCGLDPLGPTTDDCVTVDGVDWVVRPLSDGSVATTYGRDPAIEVLAPGAYGAVPLLLPAFTDVAKSLPVTGRHCS
jgi:hypothetical protein